MIVIILGILFTLDNLNVIDATDYLQYWPAGLIAVGLLKLWQVRAGQGVVGGLFLVGLGSWMLLERIVAIRIRIHDVWPLFFVFLGGYMVWKGAWGTRSPRLTDSNERVSALAIMAGVVRSNNRRSARQGSDRDTARDPAEHERVDNLLEVGVDRDGRDGAVVGTADPDGRAVGSDGDAARSGADRKVDRVRAVVGGGDLGHRVVVAIGHVQRAVGCGPRFPPVSCRR